MVLQNMAMTNACAIEDNSAAFDRRRYWAEVYEAALAANDRRTAAQAAQFVQAYDSLIDLMEIGAMLHQRQLAQRD
jgi:hypothetical protein